LGGCNKELIIVKYEIFPPTCLRIYEIGLSRLTDRDWLFSTFPEYLSFHMLHKKMPNDLFFKTIQDGILNSLGCIFFDQIFGITDDVLFCDAKTAFERSTEVFFLLIKSGCDDRSDAIIDLLLAIDAVDGILVETPEERVNSAFHRQGFHIDLHDAFIAVNEYYKNDIDELRKLYARNFAERVLHDRQVCEYISFALTEIYEEKGFPTLDSNGQIIIKLVERKAWPAWVRKTLEARERGICANCGKNFMELESVSEIDHIVSLAHGGCNDIVNLQLPCFECNHEKLDKKQLVSSSIPEYLKDWNKKGHRYKKSL
jgi:5-methylcytosine-specific restriction endonuclease McrA